MTRLLVAPLLSLLFFAILTILYIDIVSPLYNYYGLYDLLHLGKLVIAACVVVAIAFLVPVKICKVSDFLMWILYLLAIVPCMVIYGCQDRSTSYAIMLAVCYVVVDLARRLRLQPPRPPLSLSEEQIVCCCVFAVIITTCLVIASGGLTYFNLDFSKVYDVRSDIAANVFGAHRGAVYDASFLGYLTTLAFDVCNVFLVAYFLSKGKHVAALAFIVVQIAYFGMSSDKVYVYALIIPLYFWLLRRAARWLITFLTSIILLGAIANLEYVQFDSYLLAGNIFVRVFYLPAILNFSYHDIFQQLGHVYLSDSRFNPFAHYEHSLAPAFIVGWTIWGDVSTNANAGFLATSYMHFGYPGMLIYSLLVGLLLSFVDAGAANRGDLYLRISIVVIPFFKLLTSADLTTSLLSHGVLASLILSWLYTNRPEQVHVARSGMGGLRPC